MRISQMLADLPTEDSEFVESQMKALCGHIRHKFQK